MTHRLLKLLRSLHLYLGVFTAPALLFFAFSGGLQSLGLHEAARGGDYHPPAWLKSMAHMHKKQSFEVPARRPKPARVAAPAASARAVDAAPRAPAPAPRKRNLWPMKLFFVLVSISLMLSTLTGLYIASRYTRSRGRLAAAFAAGLVVPMLLLLF